MTCQPQTAGAWIGNGGKLMQPQTTMLEASKVAGTSVYDGAHKHIGEVDDLIVDTITGRVRYAMLSFGGFLGLGKDHYVVPWTSLKWDAELNGYVTGITQDQLERSPDLDPLSLRNRDSEQKLHTAFGAPIYWELEPR
jgi:sporulation protein YlmC with PRC-barrel domain